MKAPSLRRLPLTLLLLGLCACGGGTGAAHPGPRRQMLSDVAVTVIVPTYDALASAAEGLLDALRALEADPSAATLAGAQAAWRATRAVWKQSEAFAIGPAATLRTAAKIDWSPLRADRLESAIADHDEVSSATIDDLGANVKGFLALEYLLFDADGDDAAPLAALRGAPRRRAYARALAENMRDQAILLRDAWSPSGGDFAGQLAAAGPNSAAYTSVKAAVDALVNQLIVVSDDLAGRQLLAPLGAGGSPRPDLIDTARSRNGLADVLDELVGIQNVYLGTYTGRRGASLSGVVQEINPTTDYAIGTAIERSLDTAAQLPVPLEEAVASERPLVERAQQRARALMQRLEIDLVSVLGTTLRFNPNDGD